MEYIIKSVETRVSYSANTKVHSLKFALADGIPRRHSGDTTYTGLDGVLEGWGQITLAAGDPLKWQCLVR